MGFLRDSRRNGFENSFQSRGTVGIGSDVGGNGQERFAIGPTVWAE